MQFTLGSTTISVGWLIALLVLIATFILLLLGRVDTQTGLLIGALALARLL